MLARFALSNGLDLVCLVLFCRVVFCFAGLSNYLYVCLFGLCTFSSRFVAFCYVRASLLLSFLASWIRLYVCSSVTVCGVDFLLVPFVSIALFSILCCASFVLPTLRDNRGTLRILRLMIYIKVHVLCNNSYLIFRF